MKYRLVLIFSLISISGCFYDNEGNYQTYNYLCAEKADKLYHEAEAQHKKMISMGCEGEILDESLYHKCLAEETYHKVILRDWAALSCTDNSAIKN